MDKSLQNLFTRSHSRQRERCGFQTTYSHHNIELFIKTVLDWEVVSPQYDSKFQDTVDLAAWPRRKDELKLVKWLTNRGREDAEDFLGGMCDPLALYLSSTLKASLEKNKFTNLNEFMRETRKNLFAMNLTRAAETILTNYCDGDNVTPNLWGPDFTDKYTDYLLGTDMAKINILKASKTPNIIYSMMPLYIISYIFDGNELTKQDLSETVDETAQYSLHVIGLVFDLVKCRVIIADPNGPLIPGSNMEFVSIPLQCRSEEDGLSTKVSRYDLDLKHLSQASASRLGKREGVVLANASKRIRK